MDKLTKGMIAVFATILAAGMLMGAATTAETGDLQKVGWYESYPVAIYWPASTDVSELLTLPANYGQPIAYKQLQWQDQNLPLGGDAGSGTGKVAEELENTFIAIEEYGGTNIEANQITVYRQEFDGTAPTQESVVSVGEFIFTGRNGWFDPTL